jgi:anti-anti-sigma regulatory factor
MFRLTEYADTDRLVLTLEGRCSAEVVDELIASWVAARLKAAGRPIWIDLSDVLHVDPAAMAQLGRMHLAGACFVSRGCLMRELVRQITSPHTSGN